MVMQMKKSITLSFLKLLFLQLLYSISHQALPALQLFTIHKFVVNLVKITLKKILPALLTATGPDVHQDVPAVHEPRRQRDRPRNPSYCTQPPHFPASLGVQEGVIITIHPTNHIQY